LQTAALVPLGAAPDSRSRTEPEPPRHPISPPSNGYDLKRKAAKNRTYRKKGNRFVCFWNCNSINDSFLSMGSSMGL
jgi:hypothetical protein